MEAAISYDENTHYQILVTLDGGASLSEDDQLMEADRILSDIALHMGLSKIRFSCSVETNGADLVIKVNHRSHIPRSLWSTAEHVKAELGGRGHSTTYSETEIPAAKKDILKARKTLHQFDTETFRP